MLKKSFLIFLFSMLCACAQEANYRGVPETSWQQLSPAQKQLIVDRSYQDEYEKN